MKALMDVAGVKEGEVGTYDLGWVLGPRVNAAGRLASALDAVRLFCTRDPKRARQLAVKLDKLNRKRQDKTNYMVELAQKNVKSMCEEHKFLVVSHEEFHEGIIGLIAGKLTREFYLPTVAISKGGEISKGSARSVSGFNIVEVLREFEDLLESVGGHPMAAGFTIRTERINEFRESLLKRAQELLSEKDLKPTLHIDFSIPLDSVDWELWEKVRQLKPFGEANPQPIFSSRAGIVDVSTVGRNNNHLKLKLQSFNGTPFADRGKSVWSAVGFGMGGLAKELRSGDKIELAYSLLENRWNGRCYLEIKLRDLFKYLR
jgi:single-stranded-DNA-specific exonuclease